MSEKSVDQQVHLEATFQKLEAVANREKLRKRFKNESYWPIIIKGPIGLTIYALFMYPLVFFNHIIMEEKIISSLTIYQETLLRTMKRSTDTSLKTLRKTSSYMGFLNKTFHCSERFESLKPKDTEMGIKGYWLGPVKYKKKTSEATILYFHGGGYVTSTSLIAINSLCYLLKTLRKRYDKHVRVLAIDYSLAPEESFPIGLNCAERAYDWLVKSGIAGSKNVFLCGDSAGGGLILALLQKLHIGTNDKIPLPLGGLLISPWVDLTCDTSSFFTNAKFDWSSEHLGQFAESYIFGEEGNPAHDPLWQQRNEKDKIMEWLSKVEDTFDFDVENIWKRLSSNINNDKTRKRLSHLRDSFISIKSDDLLKKRDPLVEEEATNENQTKETKDDKVELTDMKESPYRNPLISPLHTPHHILAKFPPLLVTYGGKELFKDDIEMFIRKVIESKKLYNPTPVPTSDIIASTFFDSKDLNINNSLDGQHPDVVVEMDEDMVHAYPILKFAFGKHSRRAIERMAYFIANRIPLPKPIRSRQSNAPSCTSNGEKLDISTIPNSRKLPKTDFIATIIE